MAHSDSPASPVAGNGPPEENWEHRLSILMAAIRQAERDRLLRELRKMADCEFDGFVSTVESVERRLQRSTSG